MGWLVCATQCSGSSIIISSKPFQVTYSIGLIIRCNDETMAKLKKILDDSAKARRLRRIHLNIQITFLTWLVEFLGFLFVVLGSFIFGNNNIYLTFFLQMMTCFVYIVIIPSMYLLNSNDSKDHMNILMKHYDC